MYFIRDNTGSRRAIGQRFITVGDAIAELAEGVDTNPKRYPDEFPFVVIDEATGKAVYTLVLP